MTTQHIVKQGDYLTKIAAQYGFADYKPIWDYGENAQLKQKRGNPNVLYPGDVVAIPEQKPKEETASTGQRIRFQVNTVMPTLRLQLKDVNDKPIANTPCKLIVDLNSYDLTTDGDGKIEQKVPAQAKGGSIVINDDVQIPLLIGHLDPVEEQSGWQARLNNLGYNAGPPGKADEQQVRSAVEEFQCDHGLDVDGVCGPKTQKKLKEVHGC